MEINFDRLKEIWSGSSNVFALPSSISSNDWSNVEPSGAEEDFENKIPDHENEEDNIDDESTDGLKTKKNLAATHKKKLFHSKETLCFFSNPKKS